MVVDATKQGDEVARALVAADALGKASLSTTSVPFQDIADSLQELDMEHSDEEDDGVELIGTGIGDAYYPSNDMDPYLKDQNDDDSEEVEDMTITAEDAVIVCARNEDDVSHLEVWIYEDPADGDSNTYAHHDIIIPAFPLCTAWLDCPIKGGEKAPFLAVGLLEALGAAAGMAAGAILSGAAIPILSQSFLVWQLLLSYIFLGRRYRFNQLLGCFLVAIGVIITVARAKMMSWGEVFR